MVTKTAFVSISVLIGALTVLAQAASAQSVGQTANPAAHAPDDLRDQIPTGGRAVLAPPGETDTVFAPPAGNTLFKSQGTGACASLNTTVPEVTLLQATFNTAHASSHIEVNVSGQFSLGSSTQLNRIYLSCSVEQGATSVPCSAIYTQGYSMARRVLVGGTPAYAAVTNAGSYVGYVYVGSDGVIKPNTATTVKIVAKQVATSGFTLDGSGSVCFTNLVVHY